jgi:hypothetical protein
MSRHFADVEESLSLEQKLLEIIIRFVFFDTSLLHIHNVGRKGNFY